MGEGGDLVTSQFRGPKPGDQQGDRCRDQITLQPLCPFGRGELFAFKGQQNSSRHTSLANLRPDTLKSIQEHPRTRRVKN